MARIFAPLPPLFEHLSQSEYQTIRDEQPVDKISIGETLRYNGITDVKLCKTSQGRDIIVKAGRTNAIEANFMSILKHAGLPFIPDIYGYYRVVIYNVLVMEFIPGMDLTEKIWKKWSKATRQKFKLQLADALIQLRNVTAEQIERPYGKGLHSPYPTAARFSLGPYKTEEEYNTSRLEILSNSEEPESRIIGERLLAAHCENKSKLSAATTAEEVTTFVATHTDLFNHNIRVDKQGNLTGIIDFGKSGFYPEWAEFAFIQAMNFEDWWGDALEDVMRIVCPRYTKDDPIIKYEVLLKQITDPFSVYWQKNEEGIRNRGKCTVT
ncbi:hypothetical protein TWF694_006025 [Orbilia ellipsospora]|uniref:Aminoglycoside phosphotransferase domain-containing protein n=1 Tax=Orbilia ellipsospora TaxID=2528407 RepID=A0AAV9WTA4_9PEZI